MTDCIVNFVNGIMILGHFRIMLYLLKNNVKLRLGAKFAIELLQICTTEPRSQACV